MRTLAERFGFRPTQFIPNGCGAGITAKLVPDEVGGANFDDCCDLHDLAYHVGKGGFLGLFYSKPVADFKLAACMARRLDDRATKIDQRRESLIKVYIAVMALLTVPPIYFIALTLLGWTPLTWPWKERPMPSHEDLERLLAHNRND